MRPGGGTEYQLWGTDIIFDWLVSGHPRELSDKVLEWVMALTADPYPDETIPVPGFQSHVVAANIPDTDIWVTWLADEERKIVWLAKIDDATGLG
jgi:hypothetical protein